MAGKVSFALIENVIALVNEVGVQKLGFLTFTFPDHVTDPKECNRRFGNLRRRALSRYPKWIAVRERQKSGRLHLHLLVVVENNIQNGVNFSQIKNGNYASAGPNLRAEWAFWRKAAKRYGFGRTELMPIKSNGEGIARYIGKYIQKNLDCRIAADKGARLVSYSKGTGNIKANGFAWNSPRGWLWRKKLGQFARKCGILQFEELNKTFGSRWAWSLEKRVISEHLESFPTGATAQCAGYPVPLDATDIQVGASEKCIEYWAEFPDEWIAAAQKDLACSRLKRDREFFTPEREAEFNRRVAASELEAAKYPAAIVAIATSEFEEVMVGFPKGRKVGTDPEPDPF